MSDQDFFDLYYSFIERWCCGHCFKPLRGAKKLIIVVKTKHIYCSTECHVWGEAKAKGITTVLP